jgi:RNA polymerase sigma-70 factor (ECF subfamily)
MSAAQKYEIDRPSFTVIEGGLTFRSQVQEYAPKLLPRAMQLCRNQTDAEDLVQDTVERALRFEHHFLLGSNLKAWLHQVLYSVFATRCRSRGRERRALDRLGVDPCAWTNADAPPAFASLTARMAHAVESLPEAFRQVLLLVDLGELSYKDAADEIGVPIGTVMSRLHRGRRALRDALGGDLAA